MSYVVQTANHAAFFNSIFGDIVEMNAFIGAQPNGTRVQVHDTGRDEHWSFTVRKNGLPATSDIPVV